MRSFDECEAAEVAGGAPEGQVAHAALRGHIPEAGARAEDAGDTEARADQEGRRGQPDDRGEQEETTN